MSGKTLERILTGFFKGLQYSVLFGLLGLPMGWLLKWPFPMGSYWAILASGTVSMFVAVVGFVGTPKIRYEFFTRRRFTKEEQQRKRFEQLSKEEVEELGSAGISPAAVGITMMVIGFAIEALTH